MQDTWQREISYLRISLTDRCNLRCCYCMPENGVQSLEHREILRAEEIVRLVIIGAELGIRQVRLTGGEPLVRKGLVELVADLAKIPGIEDLALTTNGTLLAGQAQALKKAGLKRVNISLDTLNPQKYRAITRNGELDQVYQGIKAAWQVQLRPIKINVVAIKGFNDDELAALASLTFKYPLEVRFIELMPLGVSGEWAKGRQIAAGEIKARLETELGTLLPAQAVSGVGPAQYYRWPKALGQIGFITPITDHFCRRCNRLRLTAAGQLKPCLYSGETVGLKSALRNGAGDQALKQLWQEAVKLKPQQHSEKPSKIFMSQVGG
ncbi:MAG: GTP 3',8-cyclase MoaA [Clostridia bacterium]|nr:GTP 3',8-cyclase MoaA [Clostridia bacterium]